MNKTCNCMNLQSDSYGIEGNSSKKFTMSLKTPETAENARVFSSIALIEETEDQKRPVINLKMNFRLSGVLSIEPGMVLLEIPHNKESKSIKVPVLVTPPLKPSDLKIECSKSLRDLSFELLEEDGRVFITADVFVPAIESGPVSGEVRVVHDQSKRKDGFFVTARKVSRIRVSPSTLRFKKTKEGSEWIANALIQVAPTSSGDQSSGESAVTASLMMNGKRVGVDLKKLSSRIYKATVTSNEHDLKEASKTEQATIRWQISDGEETVRADTKFVTIRFSP